MSMMNEIINLLDPIIILLSSVLSGIAFNILIGMTLRKEVENFNIVSKDFMKFTSSLREFEERLNRLEKIIFASQDKDDSKTH